MYLDFKFILSFDSADAERILCIPLARVSHEDFLAWSGESSGEFSIRSTYKVLQRDFPNPSLASLQNPVRAFYHKLWRREIPLKIKITEWRGLKKYHPTKKNLLKRHLASDAMCPRCGDGAESLAHLFRLCPITNEVWQLLDLQWIPNYRNIEHLHWLNWIFRTGSDSQCTLVCCSLWAIWTEQNKRVNENTIRSGVDIAKFIKRYVQELECTRDGRLTMAVSKRSWSPPVEGEVQINFDAASDLSASRSGSGLIARNASRAVLASKVVLHSNVDTILKEEVVACKEAVKMEIELGLETVIVEGDSLTTIKKCQSPIFDRSEVGGYFLDIENFFSQIQTDNISACSKENEWFGGHHS